MSMSGLIEDLQALLVAHSGNLTLQSVLEIEECVLRAYIEQREKEIRSECGDENSDDAVSVESDSEGDYIDKDGNIYDINTKRLVGKKDLKTKEKVMYNVL